MDKFLRMKAISNNSYYREQNISRINIFEVQKLSTKSSKFFILENYSPYGNRDIVLHYRDSGLKHISELHRGYDPMQYPLLFPDVTDGWHVTT